MSNSNTNLQTQSSNALHNAIMEAGSKDRPPMLAPGNYVQWKSRIKRYIDTKPNRELIHYSLQNPPYIYQWAEKTVPVAEGSSETTIERYMENYKNVSQDIRDQMNAEAEAVQIILTGIDNDIYSTVDACPNACEMWKAIERLKQGESINVQDLETNLYWEFGKFTSRDGESLESYYSRFYKMMNELVRNQCNVTNHQVNVQFLLQLQPEWQRFVTLVKQSQELKTVSYHKLYDILKQHQNEVNEIRTERLARTANPLALVAQQQPVYHPPNHPTQNTQYSSTRSQQSTRNRGKAIVTSSAPTYDPEPATVTEDDEMSKEKEIDKLMALISLSFKKFGSHCKVLQETLQTYQQQPPPQGYFLKHQEQECGYYTKIHGKEFKGSVMQTHALTRANGNSNTCAVETGDSNVIPDSPDMCDNDIQNDQHDVECDDERVALANLIANLKLDVDDNKKIQKQLKKANATLTQELTECKSILAETSRTLGESNSIRDSCLVALQNKQTEFERLLKVKAYEISVVQAKHDELVKQSLLTRSHYEGLVKEKTKVITDLKLREDKDIDKMISMEHQIKFLNEIVYKRGQSIQTIQMLAPKCSTFNGRPTFANPMYHKKAQSDPATRLIPDSEEILTLADASRSKLNKDLVKPFDYTKLNSLYEIFKPPTQHYEIQFAQANEIRKKMWRKSFVKTKPNVFKNIDFLPVSKSVSKNDSLAFIHELKKEMHADLKYVESLEDELDELESDKAEFSNMYDMLLQECVSKDVMCSYLLTSSDLDEITELQCLYLHKRFARLEKHSISLEIALQECQVRLKNDTVCKEKASNVFRKEREQYVEIQDLKAQLQDKNIAISELKKLVAKCKGKSVDTKFDKPSVVRQPSAQRLPKPSVLGKPATFSNSLERQYFAKKHSRLKTK
ncbi:hypothetical protein Tco_0277541 [Tanacetum coccineum]